MEKDEGAEEEEEKAWKRVGKEKPENIKTNDKWCDLSTHEKLGRETLG